MLQSGVFQSFPRFAAIAAYQSIVSLFTDLLNQ